jgi:hypothetical protein
MWVTGLLILAASPVTGAQSVERCYSATGEPPAAGKKCQKGEATGMDQYSFENAITYALRDAAGRVPGRITGAEIIGQSMFIDAPYGVMYFVVTLRVWYVE